MEPIRSLDGLGRRLKNSNFSAMPRKSKNKSRTRKGGKNNSFSSRQSQLGGYPDKMRIRLCYTTFHSKSNVSVTGTDQVFSANGCFDPDITGAGSQPANFDDWSAVYLRYRVYGSSIDVIFQTPGSATGTGMMLVSLAARHTSTARVTITDQLDATAQPFSKDMVINGGTASTSTASLRLSMSSTTSAFLGYKTVAIDTDDTLQAQTSANPSHQWYWHIMCSMCDQASTGTLWYRTRIVYDVEFFDRIDTTIDSTLIAIPRSIVSRVQDLVRDSDEKKEEKSLMIL